MAVDMFLKLDDIKGESVDDKHSGEAALLLTAGQRHSPRIGGWEYRVVENPVAFDKAGEKVAEKQADAVNAVLKSIDEQLNQLVSYAAQQPPEHR